MLYPTLDPASFLELARTLAGESDAAALRTAGDRAYYAAFLFCRDDLAQKDHLTPVYGIEDHEFVTSALRRSWILGTYGDRERLLRRARNAVSYQTGALNASSKDVQPLAWMIETASEIISRVTAVPHR